MVVLGVLSLGFIGLFLFFVFTEKLSINKRIKTGFDIGALGLLLIFMFGVHTYSKLDYISSSEVEMDVGVLIESRDSLPLESPCREINELNHFRFSAFVIKTCSAESLKSKRDNTFEVFKENMGYLKDVWGRDNVTVHYFQKAGNAWKTCGGDPNVLVNKEICQDFFDTVGFLVDYVKYIKLLEQDVGREYVRSLAGSG